MIVVECDADESFIKILGVSRKEIRHVRGKGEVLNAIQKFNRIVGVVDADPDKSQPNLIQNYKETTRKGSITLFQHKNLPENIVIQISPDLEGWLLHRAKHHKMALKQEYHLPGSVPRLHCPRIENRPQFLRFLEDLLGRDEEYQTVRDWIWKNQLN
jgi:hypothetical protein